ncbi:type II and III secretion system protein family protein [Chelatococcus asaccharovorans]|uniref:type II and III secretion system protein family protein n=1 Tax=Chelatococcus asaccharovorans TaxID=28210 RepID=UPI00224C6D0C|nr:type II and III secretion system protein family protein [Chelatococcus asaccharovorans]CAH1650437.1 Type II/IV secretion system secretin RcpA/CpaC, associated with Flp pilus assembly [Chelatococcus asaccharovorans]CAH1686764.1 Type II/IV secretion system secretin RcpA/CpaC, associated with Flp pilus assembly [Chelatococcus asaccharovorans]
MSIALDPIPVPPPPVRRWRTDEGRRALRPMVIAMLAALLLPANPASADNGLRPGFSLEPAQIRRIDLSIGRSTVINLSRDAKEVFVADPKVANAVVRSARKLFIIGAGDGATSIIALDANGQQLASIDITVGRDMNVLRQTIKAVAPHATVEARAVGESILLTGSTSSAVEAQQIADVAGAFVATGAAGSGGKGNVINALTIRARDQVMLKVTIAEVQRNVLKQLGVDATGTWNLGRISLDAVTSNAFPVQGVPDNSVVSNFGSKNSVTLRALEQAGVARTLAEPTLTAISGETAAFLVGGEVPIPSGYSCSGTGTSTCTPSIEFKKFGVALTFTPVVLSEGRMSLRVATEVSEIDTQNSTRYASFSVPGFKVRRSETTVELPSGGSMVTAGLIQQNSRQAITGLPGLLNLPILGVLFRSRDYQRQETELMIAVSPYIAKPVSAHEIARPDDGFADAMDPQGVFLGRVNRIYGPKTGRPAHASAPNRIGFIND